MGAAERSYPLAEFQEDAVRRARSILRRRAGAIVADEVGLGKSYVALALMEEVLNDGGSVGLVVPAALRPPWKRLVRGLERRRAGGAGGGIHLVTHTRLSRGTHNVERLGAAHLLVVDEAHAFRNPATRRYRALAELCPGAGVLLLTATPVNNDPADLIHLVRLFAADNAFADIGVASLRACLTGGSDGGVAPVVRRRDDDAVRGSAAAEEVRRIGREVVIRRSRSLLGASGREIRVGGTPMAFPCRAPPEVVRYRDPRVPGATGTIAALELAPYRLAARSANPHPALMDAPAGALLRLGLLKRLESGAAAFTASLRRLLRYLRRFERAAMDGRLLRPADRLAEESGDGDAVQLLLEALVLDEPAPGLDLQALLSSTRRDLERIRELLGSFRGPDPKLELLRAWARDRPAAEKVVVFTEFRDTAAALWHALAPAGGVGRIDGSGAWLGLRPSGRRAVIERFAPMANGARAPSERERVDLLIATDVLSEGQNLQDAAVVISYDLPWNPVRLLQRIGRVDRLGSRHETVRTRLFLPADGVDDVLRLTERLRRKLGGIAATVGAEHAGELLARFADPTPRPRSSGHAGLTAGAHPGQRVDSGKRAVATEPGEPANAGEPVDGGERVDPWERLRALVERGSLEGESGATDSPPCLMGRLVVDPARTSECPDPDMWLVLVRAGGRPWLLEVPSTSPARHATEPSARWLAAALADTLSGGATADEPVPDEPAPDEATAAEALPDQRELDPILARAERFVAGQLGIRAAPPALRSRGPAGRLARQVRKRLAQLGPIPEPEVVRKAERVLGMVERGLSPAAAARINRFLRGPRGGAAASLGMVEFLDDVSGLLSPERGDGDRDGKPPQSEARRHYLSGDKALNPALPTSIDDARNMVPCAALRVIRSGRPDRSVQPVDGGGAGG